VIAFLPGPSGFVEVACARLAFDQASDQDSVGVVVIGPCKQRGTARSPMPVSIDLCGQTRGGYLLELLVLHEHEVSISADKKRSPLIRASPEGTPDMVRQ